MQSLATLTENVDTRAEGVERKQERRGAQARDKRALGNHGNKSTPQGQSADQDFSVALWRLQRTMWGITSFKRLAGCHRWLAKNSGGAQLQWTPGKARWGGLQTSESVWASPVSALRISRVRADEVTAAVETWKEESAAHTVEFLTLTVRHSREQSLKSVWDSVSAGWRGITQGASWRGGARYEGDKNRFKIKHYCRSAEVTLGENGFHVHLHVLLFLEKSLAPAERDSLQSRLFDRWKNAIVRAGFKAPTSKNGVKLEEAVKNQDAESMGAYMAKGAIRSIGDEIARGHQKQARSKKSRTPFQLLDDIATARENKENYSFDLQLWHEWEKSSLGRRQMTWSRGAKKELGVLDLTDAESLALDDEKFQVDAYSVAIIAAENWNAPAPGAQTRLSDDVDTRKIIIDEVSTAKTPAQAQKKAEKILTYLEIPFISELTNLVVEKPEPAPVNKAQAREIFNAGASFEKQSVNKLNQRFLGILGRLGALFLVRFRKMLLKYLRD